MLPVPQADSKIARGILVLILAWALVPAQEVSARVLYRGTVAAYKLNVRSKPAQDTPVVVVLEKGETVDVLEAEGGVGGWLLVQYRGEQGYVRNRPKYIILDEPGPSAAVETKTPAVEKQPQPESEPGAEKEPAPKTEAARAKKKAIDRQIREETRKMASFSQKEVEILDGLNEIDYALNQARLKAGDLRRETQVLASEIQGIRDDIGRLSASMKETEAYAGQRLNALYRMHMMGSLEMAGPPSSLFDFFVKQNAMKKVVGSDFSLLESQSRDLNQLNRLEENLSRQVESKLALEEELALQIRIQEKESQKKAAILGEIQRKKKLSQAALASLQESAQALEETLASMGLKGSAALDDTSFIRQKGQLDAPVRGKIISTYGKTRTGDYKSFTFRSGIDIKVERGEPVRSVFKGEVMFAQWLKGYGNLVIINHGDNYYTLYAHVEEVFKKKGEQVDTGEVIATAGDTGSIKGLCLHFEVRHHGKPVNPMNWLKKGA